MRAPRTLMLFVDGLGLGEADPVVNPLHRGYCPRLVSLLGEARRVDPTLDVEGLPQSATGQTAILTGENAARKLGRHAEGFPGPTLRPIIEEHNLYTRLLERGYRCTFANAYFLRNMEELRRRRRWSVSTVAAMSAFGAVRDAESMMANQAVHQDLTRAVLRDRGYTGPLISPAEAAAHLLRIAERHDFTLFEYFQTDLMAHKGTEEDVHRVLSELDEFVDAVRSFGERPGDLFLLLSDHGNIEDARTRQHTMNPVPLVAIGEGADALKRQVRRLDEFAGALLGLYPVHSDPELRSSAEGGTP